MAGKSVLTGHKNGADNVKRIVEHAAKVGVKMLTLYTLSTENIKKRSEEELSNIYGLIKTFIKNYAKSLKENGISFNVYGDLNGLPHDISTGLKELIDYLKDGTHMRLNLALNYGGRAEIMHAVQSYIDSGVHESVTEETFSKFLYSKNDPDPEIIIRTGGNNRLSNFLTWQSVYSEIFFVSEMWPDFTPELLNSIIDQYKKTERRFGK